MKIEKQIEKTLQEGGEIVPHLSRTGILCGRLLDVSRNPIQNLLPRRLKMLQRKHIIAKVNGVFVYVTSKDRPPAEYRDFEVSADNWITSTIVSAQTYGKAKYEFINQNPKNNYLKIKVRYVNSKRSRTQDRQKRHTPG